MLGGKAILMGHIPYRDFFDHHMPFAWYLSALLLIPSMGSYVTFRIVWALFVFAGLALLGFHIYKTNRSLHRYYALFVLLYPFIAMYYWTHLFLADSLAFFFIAITLWLLLVESFGVAKPRRWVVLVTTGTTAALVFSSMTYVMMAGVFYVWALYLMLMSRKKIRDVFLAIGVIVTPFFIYAAYLLLTNSWREFYISNVVYNTKLYIAIPNYVKGRFFNPFRFALTLVYNFAQQYLPLLSTVKFLDLFNPMAPLFAFATFLLLLYTFWKNKIVFLLFAFVLAFSAPRSQFHVINETDYQAAGFIMVGLVSIFFLLWARLGIVIKDKAIELGVMLATLVVIIMTMGMSMFMVKHTYERWFLRYTQKMPAINDFSTTAEFINNVLPDGGYYWVGPYEPQHQFFVKKAQLPGPYVSLLPQFREDDYFRNQFLQQLETAKPKFIIFRHLASIFNTPADIFGAFLLDWMKKDYARPTDLKWTVVGSPPSFNVNEDLYVRKSASEEMKNKLKALGYIQ